MFGKKKSSKVDFIKAGDLLIPMHHVETVSLADIETGAIEVTYQDGKLARATDFDAIEIMMQLKPSALEGRRLRWVRHVWAFHNLIAHPLMQLMVWCGFTKQAIWLHDVTVPRPKALKH